MDVPVRLEQYVGMQRTAAGVLPIEFQQWRVFVTFPNDGERMIGYLGMKPGSPLNIIINLPEQWRLKVEKAVESAANLEWKESHKLQSAMVPPMDLPDADDDEDDEE